MSKYEFSSVFAPYIYKFIDAKEAIFRAFVERYCREGT